MTELERWPSGLRRTLGKRVYVNSISRVRIPSSLLNKIMKLSLTPTKFNERIQSLDIIRGIAILGILIMNIQSFSMPGSAYSNPLAFGDLNGINKWVWIISHVFADMKFMNIFSIFFGAGIILVTSKSEIKTGKSASSALQKNFLATNLRSISCTFNLVWRYTCYICFVRIDFISTKENKTFNSVITWTYYIYCAINYVWILWSYNW